MLVAETGEQAEKYLGAIKGELEGSDSLAATYPHAVGRGARWNERSIISMSGVRVEAVGSGKALRGRRERQHRPTLVILDDLDSDDSRYLPGARERTWAWLQSVVLNLGGPETNYAAFGTLIHPEVAIGRLLKTPGWDGRLFQSIISEPLRSDLWAEWERIYSDVDAGAEDAAKRARAFYDERRAEMDEGAEVLWPERESLYDLMALRVTTGRAAFASEKQNEPLPPEGTRFSGAWFDRDELWFDQPPGGAVQLIACDPAVGSDSKTGDYSAIVWCWWKKGERTIYVDADMAVRPPPETVARIVALHREHDFRHGAFEINGFQAVMKSSLTQALAAAGTHLPILPITHTENKVMRIDRLAPILEGGYLRFRRGSPGARILVQQLRNFSHPPIDKVDGPDALEMLVGLLGHYIRSDGGGVRIAGSVTSGV